MNITALGTLVTTALNLNHSGAVDTESPPHQIYSPFLNVLSQGALLSLDQLAFGTKGRYSDCVWRTSIFQTKPGY
ncbi:hypothetical protein [Candidatus Coxiella mudrowiae]|uniref:hypothetical protein n=1 Tax=Candidatus Coxiella mudrowiae TaxID=2054173 RepID=UPI0012FED6BE|nr:hypothetical protein [Candidatus Coxiella mudrowiae]